MAVSLTDLAEFFHSLAAQLDAGIGLHEALDAQGRAMRGGRLKQAVLHWAEVVAAGRPWSEGLRETVGVLPPGSAAAIAAGEQTGRLGPCCKLLSADFERRVKLARTLMSLTWYPMLVLVFAIAVGGLLAFLNPFASIGAMLNQQGGAPSVAAVKAHNMQIGWLYVGTVITCGVIFTAAAITLRVTAPHYWYGMLPLNPRLAWRQASLQFLTTWQMGAASGLLADRALELAGESIQFPHYRRMIEKFAQRVRTENIPPSQLLGPSGFLEKNEISQVVTMEKTGSADEILGRLARAAEERFGRSLKLWVGFIVTSLIVLVIALVVVFVIAFALSYAHMLENFKV
ncbi:MAG: type II secretion system F family protein [Planctomycetota bacterium]